MKDERGSMKENRIQAVGFLVSHRSSFPLHPSRTRIDQLLTAADCLYRLRATEGHDSALPAHAGSDSGSSFEGLGEKENKSVPISDDRASPGARDNHLRRLLHCRISSTSLPCSAMQGSSPARAPSPGSVSRAYRVLDRYTTARLRRWSRTKYAVTRVTRSGYTAYPDAYLYETLRLVRLSRLGCDVPWTKP
jgi:hypothetical protein